MSTNWQNSEVRELVVIDKEDVVQVKEERADLGVELDKIKQDALSECLTLFVEEHPLVEVIEMAELKVLEVEGTLELLKEPNPGASQL